MRYQILAVDRAWAPVRWLSLDDALNLYSRGLVDMSIGSSVTRLRGGVNAVTKKQSVLEVGSILVTDTKGRMANYRWVPTLSREKLIKRDLNICAYCVQKFKDRDLTNDHIFPRSRGGQDTWSNCVLACRVCNSRKGARTPEEAKMQLHFVPYVPNLFEGFILEGRNILADQMELLTSGLPKNSRLRQGHRQ